MATKLVEVMWLQDGKGCLGKAADDEPLFILRAQDMTAPTTVLHWIGEAMIVGTPEQKLREAFELALDMRRWQGANAMKAPD